MDSELIKDLLMWLLPGGAIGSVVTWIATRRMRKMDVLQKFQESIDLLTNKYTEVLNENVQLKADNAKLLANQKAMEEKIDTLNRKIDQLTAQLRFQKDSGGTVASNTDIRRPSNRRARVSKGQVTALKRPEGRSGGTGRQHPDGSQDPPSGDDGGEDAPCGKDSGTAGSADDSDSGLDPGQGPLE